jgi:hypothetical protein
MEQLAAAAGKSLLELDADEWERLWQQAKATERSPIS